MTGYEETVPGAMFAYCERRKFRILVVGNCHAEHYAQLALMAFAECSADFIMVHMAQSDDQRVRVEDFLNLARANYDLVLAFDLDEKWGPMSRAALAERYGADKIFCIPNLTFDGLHPDMVPIGFNGGPLGDYHSRIALGAWLAGANSERAVGLFEAGTYERLGYFSAYAPAVREYDRREASTDLRFGSELVDHIQRAVGLFTKNHPTPALFTMFMHHVRNALVSAGRAPSSGMPLEPSLVARSLVTSGVVPIFPEIAQAIGLKHGGSRNFVVPRIGGYAISLSEFVAQSFAAYAEIGRERLLASPRAAQCQPMVERVM